MSTLVPGIILCVLFCVVSAVMLRNDKNIQKPPKAASAKEWTVDLGKKTWIALPILLFPVIILGGIYGGYMTPTESAAVGAAYAILAGLCIYRSVTLREIGGALINASTTAGVILISMIISELGGMSRPSMDEFANSAPMNPLLYPDSFMRGVRIDPMQHIVAAAEPVSAPNTAQVIELT